MPGEGQGLVNIVIVCCPWQHTADSEEVLWQIYLYLYVIETFTGRYTKYIRLNTLLCDRQAGFRV